MEMTSVVGFAAGAFTTVCNLPQVLKTYRTKSADDLSSRMLLFLSTGLALWEIYGIMRHDWPIILTNAGALTLALMLYVMKKVYTRRAKRESADPLNVAGRREFLREEDELAA